MTRRVLGLALGFCMVGSAAFGQLNPPGHGAGVANTDQIGKAMWAPEVHLRLDGDYTDSARRGQDGTAVGDVTFVEGVHGQGIMLDGDGDGVYVGNGQYFQFTSNHTQMAWIRPMAVEGIPDGGVLTIFAKTNDQEALPRSDEDIHGMYVEAGSAYDFEAGVFNNPFGQVFTTGSHTGGVRSVTNVATDGLWHHVCSVMDQDVPRDVTDPDTGEVIGVEYFATRDIYIDGIFDATAGDVRTWSLQANEGPVKIGRGNLHTGGTSNNWPGRQPGPGADACPRVLNPPADVVADPLEIPCRLPDYSGYIDEVRVVPGALTADQIAALADDEDLCGGGAGAGGAITSLSATPVDGLAGGVNVSIGVEGTPWVTLVSTREYEGDETMTEDTMYTRIVIGPSPADRIPATVYLPAGTWTMTAYAHDDLVCLPAADAESKITTEPFVLGLLPGHAGPRVGETAIGFTFWFETENYNFYDDDNTDRQLPDDLITDPPIADDRRGPFVFFYENGDAMFGGGLRRDGGLSRTHSLFQVLWDVDIGLAGGEEGPHLLWTRAINSYNTSDFFLVEGDPDDEPIPEDYPYTKEGGYSNSNHRINEWNKGRPFPGFGAGATTPAAETALPRPDRISGHNKDLQDGENRLVLSHRQAGPGRGSSRTIFWDGILIVTESETLAPQDSDIKALEELKLFRRGDCNGDGACDLSDGVAALNFSFLGAEAPGCLEACDFNANGALDITNAIYIFNAKFQGGPPVRAPSPDCGFAQSLVGCETSNCTDADSPFPRVRELAAQ